MPAVAVDTHSIVWYLSDDPATPCLLAPLDRSVADALESVSRDEVPDLPDRIMAATAVALGVPLITHDGKIQASQIQTIW